MLKIGVILKQKINPGLIIKIITAIIGILFVLDGTFNFGFIPVGIISDQLTTLGYQLLFAGIIIMLFPIFSIVYLKIKKKHLSTSNLKHIYYFPIIEALIIFIGFVLGILYLKIITKISEFIYFESNFGIILIGFILISNVISYNHLKKQV